MRPATKRNRAPTSPPPTEFEPVAWDEVMANLTDAVILLDASGRVLSCNPAGEQLLKLPYTQVRGRHVSAIFTRSPAVVELVARTAEVGQSQSQATETLLDNGSPIPVRVAVSPVLDRAGRPQGTVVVLHDLSFQRALQEDVQRAERLAKLGTVAAGLAHEIRNPLSGIKGAAQLLRREFGEAPAVREYTEVMVREIDRLSGLLEQLLELGAPSSPQFSEVNIHRVIRDVLTVLTGMPAARAVDVRCEFDPSLPPVRGDEKQIKQVLLNLAKNACEAMPSGGTLLLTTRVETDFHVVRPDHASAKFIRVEVADTGPGISAEDLPHIFDPFFTTKTQGTGLGLAISHQIAREHGGGLRAAPRPGGGTVMTLNLEMATAAHG